MKARLTTICPVFLSSLLLAGASSALFANTVSQREYWLYQASLAPNGKIMIVSGGSYDPSIEYNPEAPEEWVDPSRDYTLLYLIENNRFLPLDFDTSRVGIDRIAQNGTLLGREYDSNLGGFTYWTQSNSGYTKHAVNIPNRSLWASSIASNGQYIVGLSDKVEMNLEDEQFFYFPSSEGFIFDVAKENFTLLPGEMQRNTADEMLSVWVAGVNNDGSIVIGENQALTAHITEGEKDSAFCHWWNTRTQPVYWTLSDQGYQQILLKDEKGEVPVEGSATAISDDGRVIVGAMNQHIVTWKRGEADQGYSNAIIIVPHDSNQYGAWVADMSKDGTVIVGALGYAMPDIDSPAFRWTENTGLQTIEAWLASTGAPVSDRFTSTYAYQTNEDGSVILGEGFFRSDEVKYFDYSQFIARAGSGLITFKDLTASLASVMDAADNVLDLTTSVLQQNHAAPLNTLVAEAEPQTWAFQHSTSTGSLQEAGLNKRLANWAQFNFATGQNESIRNLAAYGHHQLNGHYVLPEMIMNVSGPVWMTLSMHQQEAKASMQRRYVNSGRLDASYGNTNTHSTAYRVRFDLANNDLFSKQTFTPYVDFTHTDTEIDGYTETRGGFPAKWTNKKDVSNIARLGLNFAETFATLSIQGRVEIAHRLEDSTTPYHGQLMGIMPIHLPGEALQKNWVMGLVEMSHPVPFGEIGLSLQGSSLDTETRYAGRLNYRYAF